MLEKTRKMKFSDLRLVYYNQYQQTQILLSVRVYFSSPLRLFLNCSIHTSPICFVKKKSFPPLSLEGSKEGTHTRTTGECGKKMDTGGGVSMTASVEDRMQDEISPPVHLVK